MIIVTGGSGKVGRACVKDLMEHGYKVASIDLARPAGLSNPPKPTDVNFTRADITDFGDVMAAFSGINARVEEPVTGIVHLGAIASPGEAPDHVIFAVNTVSTYNV
ncbi:MAG: NAD(P)-dependent oxidoreductase, partial [Rhizobiales bacterium]|nr:NAD(P)-dependent oxidoreductase [Hyphomicrobiales bacterium]